MRPELVMKSIIPVVMAGIVAIYGLVVAVLIAQGCEYIQVISAPKTTLTYSSLDFSQVKENLITIVTLV